MKIIAFVLSLLIAVLVTLPCSDDITCERAGQSQDHNAPVSHNHSEDEEDLCSPFCTCACCGSHIFAAAIPVYYLTVSKAIIIPAVSTFYQRNFISAYFYSFWQPPKISLS